MRTPRRSVSDFALTPLAAALGFAFAPQAAHAENAVVNDPSDAVIYDTTTHTGTLRGALFHFNGLDVNGAPFCTGADTITFDPSFTAAAPFITAPATDFPPIFCGGLTINGGGSQNDVTSRVQINGANGNFPYGLDFGLMSLTSPAAAVIVEGIEIYNVRNTLNSTGRALSGAPNSLIAIDNIVHDSDRGIGGAATARHNRVFSNTTGIFVEYGGQITTDNIVYGNDLGIDSEQVTSPIVAHNFVGIDDGTRPDVVPASNNVGIVMASNTTATVQANTITNNNVGLEMNFDSGSTVVGNNVGTDLSGANDGGGNGVGISVSQSTGTAITDNVVSTSGSGQVQVDNSTGISVGSNFLGTDRTVTKDLTGGWGVLATCSDSVAVTNNHIATSIFAGIEFDAVTNGGSVSVQGNRVGVASDGVTPLGSSAYGLFLASTSCNVGLAAKRARAKSGAVAPLGATDGIQVFDNTFDNSRLDGILIDGAYNTNIGSNTITGNGGFGINLQSAVADPGDGNVWLQNTIYNNIGGKAVNLNAGSLPLPNDPGDTDVAPVPNNGQNYPTMDPLTGVSQAAGQTTVAFTLDSLPGNYRIDLYANSPASANPGGNQYLGNTFMPITSGPASGSFTANGIFDSISLVATKVDASGNGIESSEYSPTVSLATTPNVALSATTLDFGNVSVGSTSAAQTASITSTGTAPYQLFEIENNSCYGGSICYGGPFTCTTTCQEFATYNPGQSCSVTATFNPQFTGSFSQTISICDNVAPNTRSITLTGAGVVPPPVQFTPSAFDFGTVLLGSTSDPEQFTLGNPGSSVVAIGPISATTGFVVNGTDCGTSLDPLTFCSVSVSFVPTGTGVINGTLSVAAGSGPPPLVLSSRARRGKAAVTAGPGTATASLTGTGAVQAILDLPSAIDMGGYLAGAPALSVPITLRANGNAFLTINSIGITGPFGMTNDCPANMAPGTSCTITLTFSQNALGSYSGTLDVASNAVGGTRSVPVNAETVAVAAPKLKLDPATIGFGDRLFGNPGTSQRVTITNIGTATASLGVASGNADFVVAASNCGATLDPSSSCFADVAFRPAGFGPRTGSLVVTSNSADSPQSTTLAGTGCRPFVASQRGGGGGISCAP